MATKLSLISSCPICSSNDNLRRCQGCKVVSYAAETTRYLIGMTTNASAIPSKKPRELWILKSRDCAPTR
jgi:hypothetical protein